MPPKRKAAASKASTSKAKKAKKEEVKEEAAEEGTLQDKIAKLKAADKGKAKKHKVDAEFPFSNGEVYEDYNAMLNQTNIGHNNNKFYIIQVVKSSGSFYTFNRWGRVGETGATAFQGAFASAEPAIKAFEKKFKDKTKNNWADRENFSAVKGKYTLLEMAGDDEDDEEEETYVPLADNDGKPVAPSKLDKPTQALISLIFNTNMFQEALKKFDLDTKKLPLGKLSKTQIAKGFEALEEIERAVERNEKGAKLAELSSKFYTVIPHSFGRAIPPPIKTIEDVQKKYDMLSVLGDIEIAQAMQKEKKAPPVKKEDMAPNPADQHYELLNCELKHIDEKSKEFQTLQKYFLATEGNSWRKQKLKNIWSVNRSGEGDRFKVHDTLGNRKLLWHGTSVAVVTAILKTGLRIMPHSGGRVGRGIYFASENNKSAGYVGSLQGKGIMFLNEVALGKQHRITNDNPSLKSAPKGFDSVLACGQQEPDSKGDITIKIEGKDVVVPQSKPINIPDYKNSSFWQSEYLIYKESQNRIRYLLLFDM